MGRLRWNENCGGAFDYLRFSIYFDFGFQASKVIIIADEQVVTVAIVGMSLYVVRLVWLNVFNASENGIPIVPLVFVNENKACSRFSRKVVQ